MSTVPETAQSRLPRSRPNPKTPSRPAPRQDDGKAQQQGKGSTAKPPPVTRPAKGSSRPPKPRDPTLEELEKAQSARSDRPIHRPDPKQPQEVGKNSATPPKPQEPKKQENDASRSMTKAPPVRSPEKTQPPQEASHKASPRRPEPSTPKQAGPTTDNTRPKSTPRRKLSAPPRIPSESSKSFSTPVRPETVHVHSVRASTSTPGRNAVVSRDVILPVNSPSVFVTEIDDVSDDEEGGVQNASSVSAIIQLGGMNYSHYYWLASHATWKNRCARFENLLKEDIRGCLHEYVSFDSLQLVVSAGNIHSIKLQFHMEPVVSSHSNTPLRVPSKIAPATHEEGENVELFPTLGSASTPSPPRGIPMRATESPIPSLSDASWSLRIDLVFSLKHRDLELAKHALAVYLCSPLALRGAFIYFESALTDDEDSCLFPAGTAPYIEVGSSFIAGESVTSLASCQPDKRRPEAPSRNEERTGQGHTEEILSPDLEEEQGVDTSRSAEKPVVMSIEQLPQAVVRTIINSLSYTRLARKVMGGQSVSVHWRQMIADEIASSLKANHPELLEVVRADWIDVEAQESTDDGASTSLRISVAMESRDRFESVSSALAEYFEKPEEALVGSRQYYVERFGGQLEDFPLSNTTVNGVRTIPQTKPKVKADTEDLEVPVSRSAPVGYDARHSESVGRAVSISSIEETIASEEDDVGMIEEVCSPVAESPTSLNTFPALKRQEAYEEEDEAEERTASQSAKVSQKKETLPSSSSVVVSHITLPMFSYLDVISNAAPTVTFHLQKDLYDAVSAFCSFQDISVKLTRVPDAEADDADQLRADCAVHVSKAHFLVTAHAIAKYLRSPKALSGTLTLGAATVHPVPFSPTLCYVNGVQLDEREEAASVMSTTMDRPESTTLDSACLVNIRLIGLRYESLFRIAQRDPDIERYFTSCVTEDMMEAVDSLVKWEQIKAAVEAHHRDGKLKLWEPIQLAITINGAPRAVLASHIAKYLRSSRAMLHTIRYYNTQIRDAQQDPLPVTREQVVDNSLCFINGVPIEATSKPQGEQWEDDERKRGRAAAASRSHGAADVRVRKEQRMREVYTRSPRVSQRRLRATPVYEEEEEEGSRTFNEYSSSASYSTYDRSYTDSRTRTSQGASTSFTHTATTYDSRTTPWQEWPVSRNVNRAQKIDAWHRGAPRSTPKGRPGMINVNARAMQTQPGRQGLEHRVGRGVAPSRRRDLAIPQRVSVSPAGGRYIEHVVGFDDYED